MAATLLQGKCRVRDCAGRRGALVGMLRARQYASPRPLFVGYSLNGRVVQDWCNETPRQNEKQLFFWVLF